MKGAGRAPSTMSGLSTDRFHRSFLFSGCLVSISVADRPGCASLLVLPTSSALTTNERLCPPPSSPLPPTSYERRLPPIHTRA